MTVFITGWIVTSVVVAPIVGRWLRNRPEPTLRQRAPHSSLHPYPFLGSQLSR